MSTVPKRCCNEPVKYVLVYKNDEVVSVCVEHAKKFEYQRGVKWVFDFPSNKEIAIQEAFNVSG